MDSNLFLPLTESVAKGLEKEPKITDFEQIKTLGTGAYGKVNLFKHKVTGAQYAIKIIDKKKFTFDNKGEREKFAREVEIMSKLCHPNILRLYSHFEDESYCYFVLE